MDPITLILSALSSVALAGGESFMTEAAKDAYHALKNRIQQKLANNPSAKLALNEYENDPETWRTPLQKTLVQAKIDQDQEIVEAAQRVTVLIQSQQAGTGNTTIQNFGNVQGQIGTNYGTSTQYYGGMSEPKP